MKPRIDFFTDRVQPSRPGLGLTGSTVGGNTADIVSAPGFHGDSVQSPWCEGGEDALILSGGDTLVLQDGVVIVDQHHVPVQITSCMTPVHLNTNTPSVTTVNNTAPCLYHDCKLESNSDSLVLSF